MSQRFPPFELLAYTIRSILHPTFLLKQIPDILVLIASVEMIRRTLVKAAEDLHQTHPGGALDHTGRGIMEHIRKHNISTRKALRTIVNTLASLVS